MTDFADVEQFVRQHAGCGGLTPTAAPQPAGGFLLSLACTCGETFDRWVTADEARRPLPHIPIAPSGARADAPAVETSAAPATAPPTSPPSTPSRPLTSTSPPLTPPPASLPPPESLPPPASRRARERPRVTPSRELEEAMRAALEAAPETLAGPATPSKTSGPAAREDLEALVREALAAEDAAAATPPASSPRAARPPAASGSGPRGGRAPVTRLDLDVTIRQALDRQRADAEKPREVEEPGVSRRVWIALVAIGVLGAAGGAYWYLGESDDDKPETSTPSAPKLPPEQHAALDEVVKSMRQLQASTPPDSTFPVYASRLLVTRGDIEKFAQSTASAPARTGAREFLDLHALALATLRARSLERKDTFDLLSRDPTLGLCPDVKTILDRVPQDVSQPPEQARAAAISSAVPKLWDCARVRLTALERVLAERR